ncbi:uncharacterized protein VTP21DRAFT_8689 [Calcarisporiella thermophila]|uniref:uncharacterized protein n=1 Tax=Calcarisporiella thermophila TaxID=911321 RepID=UPI003743D45D
MQDRKSSLKRSLILASALVASAGLFISSVDAAPQWWRRQDQSTCTDAECVATAEAILKDGDFNLDPCVDFYDYACSNFVKTHEVPKEKPRIGAFDILYDKNQELLKNVLEAPFKPAENTTEEETKIDQQNFEKLQALYQSCMDENTIASLGAQPALPVAKLVVDNLPLAQALPLYFNGEQQQAPPADGKAIAKLFATLRRSSISGPFQGSVDVDNKDPNSNVFWIVESGLGLPSREYYKEEDVLSVYRTAIADTFGLVLGGEGGIGAKLWPNTPLANETFTKMANQVVQIETAIANFTLSSADKSDPIKTYNPTKLADLAQLAPAVDWNLYLQTVLGEGVKLPETVFLDSPDYFKALSANVLATTPAPALQAYLLWRAIASYTGGLAVSYQMPVRRLNEKIRGVKADALPPRWQTCLGAVTNNMGQSLGRYYVLQKFTGNSKQLADDLVTGLRTTFKESLPNITWLDEPTRAKATEKIDKFTQKIGYSTNTPDVLKPSSIQKFYEGLEVNKSEYFANQLRASQWGAAKQLADFGKPVDKSVWSMNPHTVNAYYQPVFNEIVFPSGILQSPFYDAKLPEYLNYGGIGVVAGHEITHGFDDSGRSFDGTGAMNDWWTNATAQAFNERAQCFENEYSNFTVKGPDGTDVKVNGKLTLGENIADNGGLRQAFVTWKKRFDSDPQMQKYNNRLIPGLEKFTREQLYFISYARVWCSNQTPAYLVNQVRTDPHSPTRWRVNGAVKNSPYFAEAYKCPPGSPMNPADKCALW